MMNDEDMKIYIPSAGSIRSDGNESDEVKIYTCSSSVRSGEAEVEQSEHLP